MLTRRALCCLSSALLLPGKQSDQSGNAVQIAWDRDAPASQTALRELQVPEFLAPMLDRSGLNIFCGLPDGEAGALMHRVVQEACRRTLLEVQEYAACPALECGSLAYVRQVRLGDLADWTPGWDVRALAYRIAMWWGDGNGSVVVVDKTQTADSVQAAVELALCGSRVCTTLAASSIGSAVRSLLALASQGQDRRLAGLDLLSALNLVAFRGAAGTEWLVVGDDLRAALDPLHPDAWLAYIEDHRTRGWTASGVMA